MHFMMFFNPYRNIVRFACRSNHLTKCTSTNHMFQNVPGKIAYKFERKMEEKYVAITRSHKETNVIITDKVSGFLAPFQQNRS